MIGRSYDHDITLLEWDTTKKARMNEFGKMSEFGKDDDKDYKIKAIQDSAVYAKEINWQLPGLYYFVA